MVHIKILKKKNKKREGKTLLETQVIVSGFRGLEH